MAHGGCIVLLVVSVMAFKRNEEISTRQTYYKTGCLTQVVIYVPILTLTRSKKLSTLTEGASC